MKIFASCPIGQRFCAKMNRICPIVLMVHLIDGETAGSFISGVGLEFPGIGS
jgi:hypothetical protein